jgi:hypothetical protein
MKDAENLSHFSPAQAPDMMAMDLSSGRKSPAGITLDPDHHRGVIELFDLMSLVTGRPDVAPRPGARSASSKFSAGTPEELRKMQVWGAKEEFTWNSYEFVSSHDFVGDNFFVIYSCETCPAAASR